MEAATQSVVRGLRELDVFQVLSSGDVRQLLAIERTRQLVGGPDASGTGELMKALGARNSVVGTVTKVGAGLTVEIRLLDTEAQKVVAQKSLGPLAKVEQLAEQLPGLAQELVGPLLLAQQGGLLAQSREEGAEVVVDNVLVASTPMREPVKLSRGSHRVQVRKDGFIAQARTVRITPEQVTAEEFPLIPSPDFAEAYRERHGRTRVGAIVFTGAAVVGIAGALLVDRLITEPAYQAEFLPRKASIDGVVPSKLPDALKRGSANAVYNACGAAPADCQTQLDAVKGQLVGTQILTASLAAVGVISTGVASYLWLTGKDPNRYANVVASVSLGSQPGFVLSGRF